MARGQQRVLDERQVEQLAGPSKVEQPGHDPAHRLPPVVGSGSGGRRARSAPRADHDDPPAHLHHVDLGPVQLGQRLGGHHLVRGADPEPAVDQVEHPVDQRQHRVDLVGHEQHRGVRGAPARGRSARSPPLVGEVQRQQRLVAQQHRRVADQRLRHPQPLLLAAGEQPDRRVGEAAAPTAASACVDPRPRARAAAQRRAPAVPVQPEPDQVAAAQRQASGPAPAAAGCSRCRRFPGAPAGPPTIARAGGQRLQARAAPAAGSSCRTRSGRARR